MKHLLAAITLTLLLTLSACGPPSAIVQVNPTQGWNVSGTVTITPTIDAVRITGKITGLTPGRHGFHIHEFGDCSAPDASSAGAHYNPHGHKHGSPDDEEKHVGDMGNILADQNGVAIIDIGHDEIQLQGEYSVIGKAIIIHEKEDDFVSQPHGNAGARIGCGIIKEI